MFGDLLHLLLAFELTFAASEKDDTLCEHAKLILTVHLFEADTVSIALGVVVNALAHLSYRFLRDLTALFI